MMERCESSLLGALGNCIISAWRGSVTAGDMAAHHELAHQLERDYPGGIAMIVLINAVSRLPDAAAKALLRELYAVHGPHLLAVANVVLGEGFWSGGVRGVLTALHSFTARPYPTKFFSSTSSGFRWLETKGATIPLRGVTFDETMREISDFMGSPTTIKPHSPHPRGD